MLTQKESLIVFATTTIPTLTTGFVIGHKNPFPINKLYLYTLLLLIVILSVKHTTAHFSAKIKDIKKIQLLILSILFYPTGYYIAIFAKEKNPNMVAFFYATSILIMTFVMLVLFSQKENKIGPSDNLKITAEIIGLISVYSIIAKWITEGLEHNNFLAMTIGIIFVCISLFSVYIKVWKAMSEKEKNKLTK